MGLTNERQRLDHHEAFNRRFLSLSLISALLFGMAVVHTLGEIWPAQAQVKRVNLTEMVQSAGTIVTGRVVTVREGTHPDYGNVNVTFVTLELEDVLKGKASAGGRHTFMQFGGMATSRVSELPGYRVGEEAVLFLYPESEYGFTSPVGGGQGKLHLQNNPQTGSRVVTGTKGNTMLFQGLDLQKLSLSERHAVGTDVGPMEYQTFASIVRKLGTR